MSGSYKVPPPFDEKKSYENWKNEVEMWTRVTDLDKKKQALAVALSLTGRARDSALEIPADDLNKDDGMKIILLKLDSVFLKEEKDRQYDAYADFDRIKRESGVSIVDYIVEFDRRYNRLCKFEMVLPDAVLAFKLLDTAGLDVKDKQLALTACSSLSFSNMKSALKRIFGNKGREGGDGFLASEDAAFYTENSGKRENKSRFQSKLKTALPGTNPIDRYGRRSKCAICQSTFHWVKDCPHKYEKAKLTEDIDECNITLFSKDSLSDTEVFMVESLGSAVIDTACTRTVCGEKWLDHYVSRLKESELKKMESTESGRTFKFGDGGIVHSTKRVKIPAKIGQTKCQIETEVVPVDIPLLLSKMSLKRAGAVLDVENDKAIMFKQPVKLELTSSGHYCVDLTDMENPCEMEIHSEDEVLTVTDNMTRNEKQKILLKLHKQFGHASVDKLHKLLTCSGNNDDECVSILKVIVQNCDTCIRYSRPKPKPTVGLPMASSYNETVAVDLHELEKGVWYLHIIDHFTRFSAASIVTTKKPSVIVRHFIHSWISVHGPPQRLFSDNGGEFNNEEIRDMAENFNIEIKSTAAYSPWSNGLLERHNKTLTEILLKVKKDNRCDWKTALDWALMAKNSMHNVHGYSPYQLVFGQNPNLPSVLTDKPPALEGTSKSAWMAQHISVLHATRKAFTEAECSDRIRRALRKQVRPNSEKYETGDKVFYKRIDCAQWKGPGVVIGQDGAVIFVRHGGIYVRVHHSRLRKVNTLHTVQVEMGAQKLTTEDQTMVQDAEPIVMDYDSETEMIPTNDVSTDGEGNLEQPNITPDESTNGEGNLEQPNITPQLNFATRENLDLKTGQIISFSDRESGGFHTAKVLGRAGKATGKFKNWYNLQYIEPEGVAGTSGSADLEQVDNLQIVSPDNARLCTDCQENDVFIIKDESFAMAKQSELKNWRENNVFDEVIDEGQKCITTRWVCTLKETPDGIVPKARLVARGFEEINKQELPKDSPTCASESLKMVMAVICQKKWQLNSMDIKAAFLQGKELTRNVYIRPPPEAQCKGGIWKLKKCVYGLADASLYWYKSVKDTMEHLGGHVSKVDPAVFYWLDDTCNVTGVLACHVDDFLWGGSETFSTVVIPQLKNAFQVGREEHNNFNYVGMEFHSVNGEVWVQQNTYINNLQPILIDPARAVQRDTSLTPREINMLKSKIGQILWVARQSRPDLLCDINILASGTKHATVQTLHCVNKLIGKLKSEEVSLKFQYLGNDSSLKLVLFSDASMGNLLDGGTQGGHVILLMGENGRFSPICWQSKRIRRVVRSTLAGETLALADGIDNSIFLATLYSELTTGDGTQHILPIVCVTDNHSLSDALKSTKLVTEKRLRLEISSVKELINSGSIQKILWSASKEQLADCLTKKGASALVLLKTLREGVWELK